MDSQLGKIYFKLECCVKFDYWLLAELAWCNHNISTILTCCIQCMQDSIKQQNTFTIIAATNVQVIAIATMGVMNGSSIM